MNLGIYMMHRLFSYRQRWLRMLDGRRGNRQPSRQWKICREAECAPFLSRLLYISIIASASPWSISKVAALRRSKRLPQDYYRSTHDTATKAFADLEKRFGNVLNTYSRYMGGQNHSKYVSAVDTLAHCLLHFNLTSNSNSGFSMIVAAMIHFAQGVERSISKVISAYFMVEMDNPLFSE